MAIQTRLQGKMMKKYSIDLTFAKSAKLPVFGWVGEARNKEIAAQLAKMDAKMCGYAAEVQSVKFNTVVEEIAP